MKIKKITKLPSKKVPSLANQWKNALFTVNYEIKRYFFCSKSKFFRKNHQIDKNFFWKKQKNTFLMILNHVKPLRE
jgi:hypothetical protein